IYQGKPLMVYYAGAFQDVKSTNPWWWQTEQKIDPRFGSRITYRHMGGLFDAQPGNLGSPLAGLDALPIKMDSSHPAPGFWTFIDRYSLSHSYRPSFQRKPPYADYQAEAFTAAYAAPGRTIGAGWGTPPDQEAADITAADNGA